MDIRRLGGINSTRNTLGRTKIFGSVSPFSLSSDKSSVNEGDAFTITLIAEGGYYQGRSIPYTITGIDEDINESLTGNFIVDNGIATQIFTVVEDFLSEGNETFTLSLDNGDDAISVQIIDSSISSFDLSTSTSSVNEGGNFTIILTTEGVADETLVPYTITGIQDADISESLTGNFEIYDNRATATFNVVEDFITDGSETFTLTLDNGEDSQSVSIIDSSIETFSLSANRTSVNEGESFTISLSTRGVLDNISVPYTITGVTSSDISGISLSGVFTINSNLATSSFSVSADFEEEGPETFTLSLDNGKDSKSILINDTSIQTFNLSANKTSVNEGESFTILLSTQGVLNDISVPYTITGVTSSDIGGTPLSGVFTLNDNLATSSFNVSADFITEGPETFTLSLDNGKDSKSILINDTSVETFILSSNRTSVNEGESFTIALSTIGVAAGTSVGYSISGIQDADINESLTGDFNVGSNNLALTTFNVVNDSLTEGNETFKLILDNNEADISVDINDTSVNISYGLASNKTSVNEGDNFIITLTTTGIANGTSVPYTIEGIEDGDISESKTGSFTVNSNTATATFNVTEDNTVESPQTFLLTLNNNAAQVSVLINDVYSLTSNKASVNEGESFTITLSARGVADSTSVPYTVTGIQDADISESRFGSFTVNSETATATFNVISDFTTESNETFTLTLNDQTSINVSVLIVNTSVETFNLSANKTVVDEGESFTIALSTQGVLDDTSVPYTITGIASADIGNVPLSGVFTINNNLATSSFNVSADFREEGPETFTLTLDNGEDSQSVLINDTSIQTFNLSANRTSVNEGESFTITLSTQGITNDSSVPYTITGVTSADISNIPLSGVFTINNDFATSSFNVSADNITEGSETFTLSLDNGKDSKSVTINDTSIALVDQPLRLLQIGRNSSNRNPNIFPFPPRNNGAANIYDTSTHLDINEGFSTKSYMYSPDYTQTSLAGTIGPPIPRNLNSGRFLTLGTPFNQNSDYFDSIIDPSRTFTRFSGGYSGIPFSETTSSDTYDVLIFNHFNWTRHSTYRLRQTRDDGTHISPNGFSFKVQSRTPPGIMQPDTATMQLLSAHVVNGGTIIEFSEHFHSDVFVYPDDQLTSETPTRASFISQLIYDLGGITGANSGWKNKSPFSGNIAEPTSWALSNISSDLTNQIMGYAGTIVNSRSNGQAVISNRFDTSESIVHIWDGNLGHLNSNVKGKIIFLGDNSMQGTTGGEQLNFRTGLTEPLLNYVAANRQS